ETDEVYVDNLRPVAALVISPSAPDVGALVTLDASGSSDPDGAVMRYRWDLDGNGDYETPGTEPTISRAYATAGTLTLGVRAFDNDGDFGELRKSVTIGPGAGRSE